MAITDLETTGLDENFHEIIEIGLVLINQHTLEVLDTLDVKVKPQYPERINKESQKVNGFNNKDWENAISLQDAVEAYASKTAGAIFAAWPARFDRKFIDEAFRKTKIQDPTDYHDIDIFTFAIEKLRKSKGLETYRSSEVISYLGLKPEPVPHRAINGAMQAYQIYKKLREMS